MVKVGVTGGIGSGKSLICKIFTLLDVPVFYADVHAKHIINSSNEVKRSLIERFGENLYANGVLNRSYLSNIIFNNKEAIKFVNGIVHPIVERDFINWVNENNTSPYCIEEAALLFESGSFKKFDCIITVTCPEQIRIKRVMERDMVKREDVLSRIHNQWSDAEKIKLSDYIIHNDNTISIIDQVLEIHTNIVTSKQNG